MAKSKPKRSARHTGDAAPAKPAPAARGSRYAATLAVACALGLAGLLFLLRGDQGKSPASNTGSIPALTPSNPSPSAVSAPPASLSTVDLPTSAVKSAIMVTVELDFGGEVPSIAEGLKEVERRHEPADGVGRVFSILDAYGEPTEDGKKLHISMHVSMEKLGIGSLIFKRTGKTLWSSKIVQAADGSTHSEPDGLTLLFDNGAGRLLTVDGSTGPASIMQANVKEAGLPVEHLWPEDAQREITFFYSACGCPVKVMCRRQGGRIVRTSNTPVIFPDDPAVVTIIHRLMAW